MSMSSPEPLVPEQTESDSKSPPDFESGPDPGDEDDPHEEDRGYN